nr:hypothetical protein [Parvibaculum indicum]
MTQVEREPDAREIDRAIRFVHAIDEEFVSVCRQRQGSSTEDHPHAEGAEHARQ